MSSIKVLILDKHEIFRMGLRSLFESKPDFKVVGDCASGYECVQIAKEQKPDIVLMDTEPTDYNCIETIHSIMQSSPATTIIVLSQSVEEQIVFPALIAGARAYITKDTPAEEITRDVIRVYSGEVVISPPVAAKLLAEFVLLKSNRGRPELDDQAGLSKREMQVLALLTEGLSNKEIAHNLFISENTVKSHISNIMANLHVHSRHQAAMLALDKGLVREENPQPGNGKGK